MTIADHKQALRQARSAYELAQESIRDEPDSLGMQALAHQLQETERKHDLALYFGKEFYDYR